MTSYCKHILIADDDEDDIELFQNAMDEICPGLELIVATDGVKLVNLLYKIPKLDVIVLDLNMPIKNGKECLKEIRNNYQFNEIPVVILSTSNQKEDIAYCLNNGANSYFIKPSSNCEMKSIVERLCNDIGAYPVGLS